MSEESFPVLGPLRICWEVRGGICACSPSTPLRMADLKLNGLQNSTEQKLREVQKPAKEMVHKGKERLSFR